MGRFDRQSDRDAEADADTRGEADVSSSEHTRTFESIVGTAPETRDRLRSTGIETIESLAVADPAALADQTGIQVSRTAQWVADARVHCQAADSSARPDAARTQPAANPAGANRPPPRVTAEQPTAGVSRPDASGGDWNPTRRSDANHPSSTRKRPESDGGDRNLTRRSDADRPSSTRRRPESDGGGYAGGPRADAKPSEQDEFEWLSERDDSSYGRRSRDAVSGGTGTAKTPDPAAEPEREPLSRLESVFESEWQVTTGTFVIVWGIAAGLYGAGDLVTTWYALATGFTTETNPIMNAAISIHPGMMVVVKLAILAGLYKLSHAFVTDNALSLDDQIALAIPITLSLVGTYATLVNLQNLPGSLVTYVILSIIFTGISGAAAIAFYEGIPLTASGIRRTNFNQTLRTEGSDTPSTSRPADRADEAQTERRSTPSDEQESRRHDTSAHGNDRQRPNSRTRERTDPSGRAVRREQSDRSR